jgi:3'-phosphoadenosine 5'-phosphosulfate (PAPS) 3'-phosphatase
LKNKNIKESTNNIQRMTSYQKELLEEFISVSIKAGKRAIEYIQENPLEIEKKPDNTYVTQVNKTKKFTKRLTLN